MCTLTGSFSDIHEELVEKEICKGASNITDDFGTACIDVYLFYKKNEQACLQYQVEDTEETVSYKVIYQFSVFSKNEVFMEEEGAEESKNVSDDIRNDIPCSHPQEEEVASKIEGKCSSAASDIAAKLVNVRADAVPHRPIVTSFALLRVTLLSFALSATILSA